MSLQQSDVSHRPKQASHQTELPIKQANGAHGDPRDAYVRSRRGIARTLSAVRPSAHAPVNSTDTSQVDQGDRVDFNTTESIASRRLSHGQSLLIHSRPRLTNYRCSGPHSHAGHRCQSNMGRLEKERGYRRELSNHGG